MVRFEDLEGNGTVLQLDIGDVLTPKTSSKRFGFDALDRDALPFLALATIKFGKSNIKVVSRTKGGNARRTTCWGYRVLMDIGWTSVLELEESNIQFVRGYEGAAGKGPWAKHFGATHVVDDMLKHLQSCKMEADTIHSGGLVLFGAATCTEPGITPRMNFEDLAAHLGINRWLFTAARQLLGCPPDIETFGLLYRELKSRMLEGALKPVTSQDDDLDVNAVIRESGRTRESLHRKLVSKARSSASIQTQTEPQSYACRSAGVQTQTTEDDKTPPPDAAATGPRAPPPEAAAMHGGWTPVCAQVWTPVCAQVWTPQTWTSQVWTPQAWTPQTPTDPSQASTAWTSAEWRGRSQESTDRRRRDPLQWGGYRPGLVGTGNREKNEHRKRQRQAAAEKKMKP